MLPGLGTRGYELGFRVEGLGIRSLGSLRLRDDEELGFRVQGLRCLGQGWG